MNTVFLSPDMRRFCFIVRVIRSNPNSSIEPRLLARAEELFKSMTTAEKEQCATILGKKNDDHS